MFLRGRSLIGPDFSIPYQAKSIPLSALNILYKLQYLFKNMYIYIYELPSKIDYYTLID